MHATGTGISFAPGGAGKSFDAGQANYLQPASEPVVITAKFCDIENVSLAYMKVVRNEKLTLHSFYCCIFCPMFTKN